MVSRANSQMKSSNWGLRVKRALDNPRARKIVVVC